MYLVNALQESAQNCDFMVRVITIMDDVYTELYRLKRTKNMSFSEILRFLLQERERENKNMMAFAGSVSVDDIDVRALSAMKKSMQAIERHG
jgi:predicted CopG family antitoxin